MKLTSTFDVCPEVLFGFPFYYPHNLLKTVRIEHSTKKKAFIYICVRGIDFASVFEIFWWFGIFLSFLLIPSSKYSILKSYFYFENLIERYSCCCLTSNHRLAQMVYSLCLAKYLKSSIKYQHFQLTRFKGLFEPLQSLGVRRHEQSKEYTRLRSQGRVEPKFYWIILRVYV